MNQQNDNNNSVQDKIDLLIGNLLLLSIYGHYYNEIITHNTCIYDSCRQTCPNYRKYIREYLLLFCIRLVESEKKDSDEMPLSNLLLRVVGS